MAVKIVGLGKCLPGTDVAGRVVTNEEIVGILLSHGAIKPGTDRPWTPEELTPQKITELVGIRERRWAADEVNVSDMALVAAEKALADAGIGWDDIGIVALGSSTPEAIFPSTACLLLDKVIRKKISSGEWTAGEARQKLRIQAFDLLAACTSGLYAIDLVRKSLLLPETRYDYGLAIGADVPSRVLDFKDTNSDLWGDGASAAVLKRTDTEAGILCAVMGSDPLAADTTFSVGQGSRKGELGLPPNFFFKGHEVQKFVLKIIPELIMRTLEEANRLGAGDPARSRSTTSPCSSSIRPMPGSSNSRLRSLASPSRSSTSTLTAGELFLDFGPPGPTRGRRGRPRQQRGPGDGPGLRRRPDLGLRAHRVVRRPATAPAGPPRGD